MIFHKLHMNLFIVTTVEEYSLSPALYAAKNLKHLANAFTM
jgi:hypothetical protein